VRTAQQEDGWSAQHMKIPVETANWPQARIDDLHERVGRYLARHAVQRNHEGAALVSEMMDHFNEFYEAVARSAEERFPPHDLNDVDEHGRCRWDVVEESLLRRAERAELKLAAIATLVGSAKEESTK
jgi:hypothetical protein